MSLLVFMCVSIVGAAFAQECPTGSRTVSVGGDPMLLSLVTAWTEAYTSNVCDSTSFDLLPESMALDLCGGSGQRLDVGMTVRDWEVNEATPARNGFYYSCVLGDTGRSFIQLQVAYTGGRQGYLPLYVNVLQFVPVLDAMRSFFDFAFSSDGDTILENAGGYIALSQDMKDAMLRRVNRRFPGLPCLRCQPPPATPFPTQSTSTSPTVSPSASSFPSTEPPYQFFQCENTEFDPMNNTCCNGLDGLCDFPINKVHFGFMHNAAATAEDGFNIPNHVQNLEKAVEAGYRAIELDVGRCDGDVVFYHAVCGLGNRPIRPVFEFIDQFLADNPTEVIVIYFQMLLDRSMGNIHDLSLIIRSISGMVDRIYQHPFVIDRSEVVLPSSTWPTLGDLVSQDKRLLLFYSGPERVPCENAVPPASVEEGSTLCPYGFRPWYDFVTPTVFGFDTLEDVSNPASCRLLGTASSSNFDWFLVVGFLRVPILEESQQMNEFEFISRRVEMCSSLNENRTVNFYSVDFSGEGDVLEWVQESNKRLILGTP